MCDDYHIFMTGYIGWGVLGIVIEFFVFRWFYRICKEPAGKVGFLLNAIDNDDCTIHFYEKESLDEIYQVNGMINQIATMF